LLHRRPKGGWLSARPPGAATTGTPSTAATASGQQRRDVVPLSDVAMPDPTLLHIRQRATTHGAGAAPTKGEAVRTGPTRDAERPGRARRIHAAARAGRADRNRA